MHVDDMSFPHLTKFRSTEFLLFQRFQRALNTVASFSNLGIFSKFALFTASRTVVLKMKHEFVTRQKQDALHRRGIRSLESNVVSLCYL